MPIFPLPLVMFPEVRLPLQIFEPRYLDLVKQSLHSDMPFGIVCSSPELQSVGTAVKIVDFFQKDNGLLGIVCEGLHRFDLKPVEGVFEDRINYATTVELTNDGPEDVAIEHAELIDIVDNLLDHEVVRELNYPNLPRQEAWFDQGHLLSMHLAYLLPMDLALKNELLRENFLARRLSLIQDWIENARVKG